MTDKSRPSPIPYRHEIDGLRAVAVLSVLGYHAGYNDMSGGFIGVDVFLVISGFLITQQVQIALMSGTFDLPRFWLRRALRLLPAILPVLAFCVLSALILKGNGAFGDFLGHLLGAGLFVSNYVFLAETDYFARASETNLLLHTWSLSLEMQFYLIMPLVLIVAYRFGRIGQLLALAGLAAASIALSQWLIVTGRESWAFFGILPRFWEFAVGGMIALLPRLPRTIPLLGLVARVLGLGLILWMVGSYVSGDFPGLGALPPVIGTALILAAPDQRYDALRWLFESRGMRWIGVRSYAIYLVHWPLMVTVTPAEMNKSEGILSVAILVSLFLGHLLYRYVETPLRGHPRMKSTRNIAGFAAGSAAAVLVVWGLGHSPLATGLRTVLPLQTARAAVEEIDQARKQARVTFEQIHANDYPGTTMCSFDSIVGAGEMLDCLSAASASGSRTLLIGDSHGRDTLDALVRAFPDTHVTALHQSSCSATTYEVRNSVCFPDLVEILAEARAMDLFDHVLFSSRWWIGTFDTVGDTLARTRALGFPVFVIGPGPTFSAPMDSQIFRLAFDGETLASVEGQLGFDQLAFDGAQANRELRRIAEQTGSGYLDRWRLFCADTFCRVTDPASGAALFFDDQHLSPAGMAFYANALAQDAALADFMTGE